MDVTKVAALKSELQAVALALETAEGQACDVRATVASISRRLDRIERALQPKRFRPGAGKLAGPGDKPGGAGGQSAA